MGVTQEIHVHSRLTVVPEKPTAAKKIHPLSYLDHMMKCHTIKATYYYDTSNVQNRMGLLDGLKDALCRSLSTYPLFAGRFQKKQDGTWEVKCNDAGVRIYEAKCDLTLEEFFAKCKKDYRLESVLNRMEINADHTITPVSVIQFTEFGCGKIAIGTSWSHAIGDAMCGTLFMKTWSETFRAAQIIHPPFFHPPSLKPRDKVNLEVKSRDYYTTKFLGARDKDQNDAKAETESQTAVPKDFGTITLSFSEETIGKIIEEVQEGSIKYGPPTPSDVISALLWKAILRAQGKSEADEAKASLCLEFRKIHLPPLPYGYVGNAVHFTGISANAGEVLNQDLSYASSLINEASGLIDTEEVRSVVDLVHEMEVQGKEVLKKPPLFYSDGLTIVNFDHFLCYDVIFDFGKPIRVGYRIEPVGGEGQVIVLPGPDGKSSRIVVVSLPEDVINALVEDGELLRFLPDL